VQRGQSQTLVVLKAANMQVTRVQITQMQITIIVVVKKNKQQCHSNAVKNIIMFVSFHKLFLNHLCPLFPIFLYEQWPQAEQIVHLPGKMLNSVAENDDSVVFCFIKYPLQK
jgi:hypothetical protein